MPARAVCSALGRVGKTTVALRLARALDSRGHLCVLLDAAPTGAPLGWLAPVIGHEISRAR